jgi:hypothetical protein
MYEPPEVMISLLWLVVAIIALIPLAIFYISYRRVQSTKLLLTTLAFLVFFVKALLLSMNLFIPFIDDDFWVFIAGFMDIIIIVLITLSLQRKS